GGVLQLLLAGRSFRFGALQIHQLQRDSLPLAPFHAVVADPIFLYLIFADHIEGSILQVELYICRPSGQDQDKKRRGRLPNHTLTLASRLCGAAWQAARVADTRWPPRG